MCWSLPLTSYQFLITWSITDNICLIQSKTKNTKATTTVNCIPCLDAQWFCSQWTRRGSVLKACKCNREQQATAVNWVFWCVTVRRWAIKLKIRVFSYTLQCWQVISGSIQEAFWVSASYLSERKHTHTHRYSASIWMKQMQTKQTTVWYSFLVPRMPNCYKYKDLHPYIYVFAMKLSKLICYLSKNTWQLRMPSL